MVVREQLARLIILFLSNFEIQLTASQGPEVRLNDGLVEERAAELKPLLQPHPVAGVPLGEEGRDPVVLY